MDLRKKLNTIFPLIKKYRYIFLIIVIGLLLMTIPVTTEKNDPDVANYTVVEKEDQVLLLEDRLSVLLSQVEGAGDVKVVLTVSEGEEVVYQTNDDISSSGDTSGTNKDTVTVTDADRNQTGLIRQINPAVFKGAIIVCQGADNSTVRLLLVEAVSKLTGLGANCISVLKMK